MAFFFRCFKGSVRRNVVHSVKMWRLLLLNPILSFSSVNTEENGLSAVPLQKGHSAGDANAYLGVGEILAKPNVPPQTIQATEEQTMAPTPVKKAGKIKQQIDVKAELEKRQGGKHLLNLVVIGNLYLLGTYMVLNPPSSVF